MKPGVAAGCLLLAIFSSACPGNACTVVLQEHYVLRDFAIQVYGWRGQAVPGARVVLSPSIHGNPGPEPLSATTDAAGIARFRNVPVGAYGATTEMPDGGFLELTVVDSGPMELARPDMHLKWPNLEVVSTQSASGRLELDTTPPLRLDLLESETGKQLESVMTDTEGRFQFSDVGPGLYFIHITNHSSEGDIPISIEPSAKNAKIDLLIGWSTCGLAYSEIAKCVPSSPLEVANLCGRVEDPSGAIVGNAAIQVISAAGEPKSARTLSRERDGTFVLSGISPGQYTLRISRDGFHKVELPVRVQDGTGNSCAEAIVVTLGVFASCSKAEIETRN